MNSYGMTEDEKRKEIVENLDLNMFVEAGAGAGKTSLIVSRIVNMLSQNVEPREIVVITFTNAAAEELRSRITKELSQKAAGDPVIDEKLNRLNEMNISTIHSFCSVLLHEQGLVTKLPIGLEVIDEDEAKKEKLELLDKYLKTLTKSDWDMLLGEGENGRLDRKDREKLEELYLQMVNCPEDTDIHIPKPLDIKERSKVFEAVKNLKKFVYGDELEGIPTLEQRFITEINGCVKPDNAEKNGLPTSVSNYSESLVYCNDGKNLFDPIVAEVLLKDHSIECEKNLYYSLFKIPYKAFTPSNALKKVIDTDKLKDANAKIDDLIRKILPADICGLIEKKSSNSDQEDEEELSFEEELEIGFKKNSHNIALLECAKKARDYYFANLSRNKVSNNRLMELTRNLILNEDKSALRFFSKKYTRFFVDEFQDTDRIQEAFIYRLATEVDDETKLRPGALFVVGDPKQSIYRFRGAQPEVYFITKKKMEALDNSKVYELSYNYRSNDEIVRWVNAKFDASEKITPLVDEDGYFYKPMEEKKKMLKGPNVIGGIYHVGNPDAEMSIGDVVRHMKSGDKVVEGFMESSSTQENDIENVINLIFNLTRKDENGEGYFKITDYELKNIEDGSYTFEPYLRDIKLSDFLLISGEMTQMDRYIYTLKKYGIPVVLAGRENLSADKGLVVFVRLYQYLVNPRDSFYRVGAEEALRETLQIGDEDELDKLISDILSCLYEDAESLSAYGLAEYLERQLSVLFDKDKAISKVDILSTQAHIRQMIENLCMNVSGTGIVMAEEMQSYLEKSLERELSLEENADAVHFMNLHKTKGLQGNIVIFLDRRGRRESATSCCMVGGTFYPGCKGLTSLDDLKDIVEKEKNATKAEFHRLEYVAVTRAAQAVVFMDVISKNGYFAKGGLKGKIKKEELDENLKEKSIYSGFNDETFSYEIRLSNNILDKIKNVLNTNELKNKLYVAENPKNYDIHLDDYVEVRNPEVNSEIKSVKESGAVKKESPSLLEKTTSKNKVEAIKRAVEAGRKKSDEYNWDMLRPVGDVAGDILHRSLELLVGRRFSGAEISVENSVNQAVSENEERLYSVQSSIKKRLEDEGYPENASEITEEKTREIVSDFITACAKAYDSYLDGIWGNVANVYPEVHFSYRKDGAEDETVWMNGTADLILEMKDGTYQLIDYKSDNDFLLSEDTMTAVLLEKYLPQLEVYRGVIQTMLGVQPESIKTGIISFSQKKEDGTLLTGQEVRVRYTGTGA